MIGSSGLIANSPLTTELFINDQRINLSKSGKYLLGDALTDANAKVVEEKAMGQRELAYEINKFTTGYYFLFVVEANSEAEKEFNRVARINESLLRHLIVRVED